MMYCSIYTTWPDIATAKYAAEVIVREKLAACANITDNITSIYQWKGALQEDAEVVVIFKSKSNLFTKIEERVLALHPSDVPCIVSLPVESMNSAYQKWLDNETLPS